MKHSKKLIAVVAFAAVAALVISTQTFSKKDFVAKNIEALADDEDHVGRWRTVGCGSYAFGDWATYCCPNSDYDNCPGPGSCHRSPIYGCD